MIRKWKLSTPSRNIIQFRKTNSKHKKREYDGEIYKCQHCGIVIDADYNASINILHRGVIVPLSNKNKDYLFSLFFVTINKGIKPLIMKTFNQFIKTKTANTLNEATKSVGEFNIFVGLPNAPAEGGWIKNVENYKSVAELQNKIDSLVGKGKDYIISDFEPFIHGVTVEHMNAKELFELAQMFKEAIADHNFDAFVVYLGIEGDDVTYEDFTDNFEGEHESTADFAENLADEMGDLKDIPDWLKMSIDWNVAWNNHLKFDYYSERSEATHNLYIFRHR